MIFPCCEAVINYQASGSTLSPLPVHPRPLDSPSQTLPQGNPHKRPMAEITGKRNARCKGESWRITAIASITHWSPFTQCRKGYRPIRYYFPSSPLITYLPHRLSPSNKKQNILQHRPNSSSSNLPHALIPRAKKVFWFRREGPSYADCRISVIELSILPTH